MTLHQTLYRKLTVLIPTLPEVPEYVKSQVPGFMDLNLDVLSRNDEIITIALSYYYEQNGDLIPGPDRLIPSKGYVRGNVKIISKRASMLKADAEPYEIQRLAAYVGQQERASP